MYHYVHKFNKDFPYQKFLDIQHFKKQINHFKKKFGIISNENEIFTENKKILLTFDDGFKHHLKIARLLKKLNVTGIFFICTKTLSNKIILPVHKIHIIISKIKPLKAYSVLKQILLKNKILLSKQKNLKFKNIYAHQNDDKLKKDFKKIINYVIKEKYKDIILDELIDKFNIKTNYNNFYLN